VNTRQGNDVVDLNAETGVPMTSTVSTGVRPGHTIHDRMRHWAEADPHRVAIRFGDDEIT
jgi:hypothetical protein